MNFTRDVNTSNNLSSQRFGKLTAIFPLKGKDNANRTRIYYQCKCECGGEKIVSYNSLISGNCKSCGCISHPRRENCKLFKGYKEISPSILRKIKYRARKNKFQFNLTNKYIWDLFIKQNRKCAISGIELSFNSQANDCDGNASLDRIDSNNGYIQGNVQWLDKKINQMKWDTKEKDFLNLISIIYKYNFHE